jgi:hypothetical protein
VFLWCIHPPTEVHDIIIAALTVSTVPSLLYAPPPVRVYVCLFSLQFLDDKSSWEPAIHRQVLDCLTLFAEHTYEARRDTEFCVHAVLRPVCLYIVRGATHFGEQDGTISAVEAAMALLSQLLRTRCSRVAMDLLIADFASAQSSGDFSPCVFVLTAVIGHFMPFLASTVYRKNAILAYKRLERSLAPKYSEGMPDELAGLLRECFPVRMRG